MPNTHGLSTLTFAVPNITGYVVQSYTLNSNSANVIEVFNESGNRVCVRYDDVTNEISVDAVLAGATLPTPGATFTYDGIKYECLSVEKKGENKNSVKVALKGKKSEYITLP
jgi:hypothetical protein